MGRTGRMRTHPALIGATPRLASGMLMIALFSSRGLEKINACSDPIHHGLEKWKGNQNQVSIYNGEGEQDRGWIEEAIHAPNRNTCNQVRM